MPWTGPDLADLLPTWKLALRAERKSPATVACYGEGVLGFLRWCADTGIPPELTRSSAQAFTAALLDGGAQAATARARHMALRRFGAWLTDDGELDANPLDGVKPPKLDTKVTAALSDDELKRLIKACQGKDFVDRRDEAAEDDGPTVDARITGAEIVAGSDGHGTACESCPFAHR